MQTTISGGGSVGKITEILNSLDCKICLLVCDSAFDFLGIKDLLYKDNLHFVRFSDFTPNPVYEDVVKGVEVLRKENCEGIVAIGGGSAIDVAKCIKLFSNLPYSENYLQEDWQDSGIPFIAVPTTAGTGSESTKFAVIYKNGIKQSINHKSIIPSFAILDPDLLKTLPLYQKKCTLLDALCQGIESWWSVKSTAESQKYSKNAVKSIIKNYKAYIFENSSSAAEKIMEASNLAGRAINIAETTAPHAMSYKMTSLYNLPHGHAVALGLPHVLEYMLSHKHLCIDPRGEEHLTAVFNDIANCLGRKNPNEAVNFLKEMLKELHINPPQIPESELKILCNSVNSVRLKNNPIRLTPEAIYSIYKKIGGITNDS